MIFIFIYVVRENYIEILSLILICLKNNVEKFEVFQKRKRDTRRLKIIPLAIIT